MRSDRSRPPEQVRTRNAHYEQDINYAVQVCRWIMKPIGMWHVIHGHPSQTEKFISAILIFICFASLFFVFVPSVLHSLFREKDIYIRIKLVGPVGFCVTSTIKYCYFALRSTEFGDCIKHVENDWRVVWDQDHRRAMLKTALIGRRLSMLSVLFLYTGGNSYHIVLPLSSRVKINENFTFKPLVYPGYDMFYDYQASPAYELTFLGHLLYALITFNITTSACSLAATFVTHACGQVHVLMLLLDDLVEGKKSEEKTLQKRMKLIVRHHIRMLRFSTNVEKVLREICLMELMTSTLTICFLEYYVMTEWKNNDPVAILTYFIILISFTFNILIFCYIGEFLVEQVIPMRTILILYIFMQYNKIGSAVYDIDWYKLSGNKAFDLVMIITMSHYPPKLTAGKFCDLSINTFGSVLKTSVAYLNLLRTVDA